MRDWWPYYAGYRIGRAILYRYRPARRSSKEQENESTEGYGQWVFALIMVSIFCLPLILAFWPTPIMLSTPLVAEVGAVVIAIWGIKESQERRGN